MQVLCIFRFNQVKAQIKLYFTVEIAQILGGGGWRTALSYGTAQLAAQLLALSLLVQFYSYYFDCLVFKYFALSAGLDCSYVVLGVQYAMGQFLC